MKKVAIMGLGLMGGSLGLALKARGFAGLVSGYARREETRREALHRGVVDEACARPGEAVRDADLVVLCTPILTIPELVRDCLSGLKPEALLTDVGSTKAGLIHLLDDMLQGHSPVFIGSHPIAGSEKQGLEAARPDLYQAAVVVVTPTERTPPARAGDLRRFWESLGAMVRLMTPEAHDRVMARTSHLPHVVATLLAVTVGRDGDLRQTGAFCGPGFRDTSRVAEGSPDVWRDILQSNGTAVLGELKTFRDELDRVINLLQQQQYTDIKEWLARGGDSRRALLQARQQCKMEGEA